MAAWGGIVAVLLVLGSIPFFLGLAVVVPLLGHATLAPVPEGSGAQSESAIGSAAPAPGATAGGGFPGRPVPWRQKSR